MAPYKKIKNNQTKYYNPVGPQAPVTAADMEHAAGLRETEINTEPAVGLYSLSATIISPPS